MASPVEQLQSPVGLAMALSHFHILERTKNNRKKCDQNRGRNSNYAEILNQSLSSVM